jgi:hypothetical protein
MSMTNRPATEFSDAGLDNSWPAAKLPAVGQIVKLPESMKYPVPSRGEPVPLQGELLKPEVLGTLP